MLAEIITIGDEILIGQIVDTNSAYLGKQLNKIGIDVYQITSIQDHKNHILSALSAAEKRVDIVLITGGLGPTKDDITKHTLCEYFNDNLVQNDTVLQHIEQLFANHITNTPISDLNRKQALVPSKAIVLHNALGTAPGMWIENNNTVFISMPGVPYEMKGLIENQVLPKLQSEFDRPFIIHKTVITYGLGESAIANTIEAWEDALPKFIKLAYLPAPGKVRLRLSARGKNKEVLENELSNQIDKLYHIIGEIISGLEEDGELEVILGKHLKEHHKTIATAESCTGGKIAEIITSIAGASTYFKGSMVTYATATKVNVLKVSQSTIDEFSVVSAQVAEEMAKNVQQLMKTDYAIATTGNAGPDKGDADAEIGTVYIAIATPTKVFSEKFNLGKSREAVINKAVNNSLRMVLKEILKNN
ncbi:competence/damage-inducible protein A [Zhouia sp. PK063]|uniref:competence/damage-inducible protein A n=1 Tax=Zhouia sp. PK063 TaxID=3373602 RepID=UPI00378A2491